MCLNRLGESPLHTAAKHADGVMLGLLIKGGAFLEAKNVEGSTPLHVAALSNREDSVETLLQNRADVNAIGQNGCTPLHLAVINDNIEIVKLLLHSKANVHLEFSDNSGESYTALDVAEASKNKKIIDLLLLHGAYDDKC